MRQFSEELADHLQQTVTTLCTCWIVKRSDGVELGFTNHDHNLQIEGVTCQAATGFQTSEAQVEFVAHPISNAQGLIFR